MVFECSEGWGPEVLLSRKELRGMGWWVAFQRDSSLRFHTDCHHIVLDLKDVSLVDRDVMSFFARCEADGMNLENCAPYIREWMEREKD